MSIIAKLRIEHDRLALVPTLQVLDGVEVRVVSQRNTAPGATVFPFLIDYEDRDELESVLADDETVADYELVDWIDESGIYYIEHTPETQFISNAVTDVNGFLIQAATDSSGWIVRVLLPSREDLNTVWEYAKDHDIAFEILELYENEDTEGEMSYGLTEEQRTALRLAYHSGYFGEPRATSLDEVSDELGLSSTATSGRLRRGMRNLVSATLIDEAAED